jgi:aspartate-semialdehyde dehydrogenase
MHVGIVGASGLVGRTMLSALENETELVHQVSVFASQRSIGRKLPFRGKFLALKRTQADIFSDCDVVLSSAGSEMAAELGQWARTHKTLLIDNSSAWRMHNDVPLLVPEVNPQALADHNYIIANPNCSTIQLVVVLAPLDKDYGIERVIVSTYQSISGAGQKGLDQFKQEQLGNQVVSPPLQQPILDNVIPHIDHFLDDDYTREEHKMVRETGKILGRALPMSCTCVRVPTLYGHGESVNIELEKPASAAALRVLLESTASVVVQDSPAACKYPMPVLASGHDEVFVGRIRRDSSRKNTFNLWIVADNLRKGAAVNAVQILKLWAGREM